MQHGDQISLRTVYMRGGTSRALMFRREDLPPLEADGGMGTWNWIFLAAIGSPDPHGRQLNGIGGGISSLSKVAVIGRSSHPEADVDYTFGQVAVDSANVGYKGNCGNISSAVGPFAVDEGIVEAKGDTALVRIHNTNTGKIIHARFPLVNGKAATQGEFQIQGVAGSGARIELRFLDPGGAGTGKLFPTGRTSDVLEVPGIGKVGVSMVDAANPVVMARASSFGLTGAESPAAIGADERLMQALKQLRIQAALAMGLAHSEEEARTTAGNVPQVALLTHPSQLEGAPTGADLALRIISADIPHKASPLTGALCLAVAANVSGTLAHELAARHGKEINLWHPGGLLQVAADVEERGVATSVRSAIVYRTARRLMEGRVFVPA